MVRIGVSVHPSVQHVSLDHLVHLRLGHNPNPNVVTAPLATTDGEEKEEEGQKQKQEA